MKGNRASKATQQTKLDKYTLPKDVTMGTASGEPNTEVGELTLKDIMAAIQDVKGVLETKIDTTAVEVNLIRTDF